MFNDDYINLQTLYTFRYAYTGDMYAYNKTVCIYVCIYVYIFTKKTIMIN